VSLSRPSLRRLLVAAVAAGACAGLGLFLLQEWTVAPLMERAEHYEHDASAATLQAEHAEPSPDRSERIVSERIVSTAVGTILTGIAFAALVLGFASLLDVQLDARRGLMLGLAGFICFALAPSLGLPPQPPGAPGAELRAAQMWWWATALASTAALCIMFSSRLPALARSAGVLLLVLPHVVGAPQQPRSTVLPPDLVREFVWWSLVTRCPFWLLLGGLGGFFMSDRFDRRASLRWR
jgi:cobalt transporter subunit CbtA